MVKLYNTLGRKKEEFKPIKKGKVGIYTCGPTVYSFAHTGNLRSYVFSDLLKRVLMYNGFEVKHIINVTDVGHLTGDSDDGEDKMEASAKKEGRTAKEISEFYYNSFHDDFVSLNLIEPYKWAWATKHIEDQIKLIKILEKKGYTYKTSDGIYFDTSKFKRYGSLSNKKLDEVDPGNRVTLKEKKNPTDFSLWKFSGNEKRQQEWKSPWGVGFPGWHIECSAMSSKYLGEHFDIHTGGIDNMPIHHENEIAQSECAFEKHPWVNFWMHGGFLNFEGKKMSKSKGEIRTLTEAKKEGICPMAYKYFTYTVSYRKPLNWSNEAVKSAVNSYKKLKNIIKRIESKGEINEKYLKEFKERINDDLDMPGALAVLWKLVRDGKAEGKIETIKKMDQVFGLRLLEISKVEVPSEVKDLAEKRLKARNKEDWALSDELRDKIKEKRFIIKDTKNGYSLEKE